MNTAEPVLRLMNWLLDNPWSIFCIIVIIAACAIWLRSSSHKSSGNYYFDNNGLPRCYVCMDASKTSHKVVYFDEASAKQAAQHYQSRFGGTTQRSYFEAKCRFWHLTSQERHAPRSRSI